MVSGLTNGTAYTFTVVAINAAGNSVASTATSAVTPITVSGAPTSPVATAGNTQASVAFVAPVSTGGSTITGYTVTSSPTGFTGTGASSPIVVSGLSNGTAYTFTVVATNAAGNSVASTASVAVTPFTVPNAPTSPVATAGNAQASIAFVAPIFNGGSAITSYKVTSSPGGFFNTGASSPIVVSGLTNGTAYTFTVVAINAAGNSVASTASATKTPTPPALPANITLSPISSYLIASVYDQDYLPYTPPTTTATLATAQAANGSNEAVLLNVQGTLTTTGVTIKIPYTVVTASVTLPAYSQTINIPASYTQDGIARDVIFSYLGGTYAIGTGNISATLKSLVGTLNVKMLDIQTGIGNDGLGVLLAQFMYTTNSSGGFDNMDFRAIAGIPDRAMGQTINGANNHNFLYMPKADANGKIWLNNNLGANYSNTALASFNLAQQATSAMDPNAYGSLYQWGRLSDGHELMYYPSNTTFSPVNTSVTSLSISDNPSSNNFFKTTAAPDDWRSGQNSSLWQGVDGINNPCPIGFRIATFTELEAVRTSWSTQNASGAYNSLLKFTMSGHRYQDGTGTTTGNHGYLWTSSINSTNATAIWFNSTVASNSSWPRAFAYGVRCIKD